MKRIVTAGTALLLASTVLAGMALAQPRGYGPGFGYGMMDPGSGMGFGYGGYGMMGGPGYGMGMMMGRGRSMMMDFNDDGVVSAEEAASAADEVFTVMDADDDGKLTEDEYMAVRMGPQFGFNSERHAAMQKAKQERFGVMDGDSDGTVSKAEFLDAAKAHLAAADADGDGRITPWEYRRQDWN